MRVIAWLYALASAVLALVAFRAISTDILHFPARVLVRQAAMSWNAQRLFPGQGSADLLAPRAIPRFPDCASGCTSRGGSIGQSVNTPWLCGRVRLKGISRTTPIGWLQHVSGARLPRVTVDLWAPHPPCRSTSVHPPGFHDHHGNAGDLKRPGVVTSENREIVNDLGVVISSIRKSISMWEICGNGVQNQPKPA